MEGEKDSLALRQMSGTGRGAAASGIAAAVLAAFLLQPGAAQASPVLHIACAEGPYHIKPFRMTIDPGARSVEVSSAPEMSTDPSDPPTIGKATVEWSFMRGWIVFHRDTMTLEWDASAEYDYLENIGQTPDEPRSAYAGRSHCTSDGAP